MIALQKRIAVLLIVIGSILFILNSGFYLESFLSINYVKPIKNSTFIKRPNSYLDNHIKTDKKINFKKGEIIGTLKIPKLNQSFPIYEGTTSEILRKGVGHYSSSVLPGEENNSILSGHRDTVFRGLEKLQPNDKLLVSTNDTEYVYKIHKIRIVHEDDQTILTPKPRAILTLTTCYPFRYIGNAKDRYIISALLISKANKQYHNLYQYK